jgi:hypothetical protein
MVTALPTIALREGALDTLTAEQIGVSLNWKALKASYLFGVVPKTPGPPALLAQAEIRYVPAGLAVLLNLKFGLDE